ncbi:MAG: hypothetical protein IJ229_09910, partial [Clostridia bacterium]|nr:hypothetical protein [Clostridia bacterium]
MRLGFSYVGFVYAIMLLFPYLRERRKLPEEDRRCARPEGGVLRVCQRIGAILTCAVGLLFSDFNLREWTLWSLWLCASMLCMACYVLYHLSRGRDRSGRLFAGAICPVLVFLFLGIYGVNVWLMLASVLYGIGNIGLRLLAAREEAVYEKKRPVRRILRFTGVLFASLLLIALLLPIGARDIRFMKHWANFAKGVDEQTYLSIGGQEQYVLMMGRDVTNPVIVYLHGGPAAPDTMVMYTFADQLMDSFTFVGWDQRGAGRAYYRNRASDPNNRTATFASAL